MPDTPEPIYSPGVKRPDPLTRFVNRDRELNIVVETLLNLSLDRASQILTFHGVGGQGKSLLCRKIKEAIRSDPTFEDVRLAFVNLEHHPEREPIFLLVWLRNALMEAGGVRLLAFDLAFEAYRSAARKGTPLPEIDSPWTQWATDIFGEGLGDAAADAIVDGARELFDEAAKSVPFVGAVLRRVGKYAIRKGLGNLLQFENDCLKELYENGQLVEKDEFEKRLVHIFAKSLENWRKSHPEQRFLFLIDEYERALDQGGAGSLHAENLFDTTMRRIVASCEASLFVIFSREPLNWPPAWTKFLAGRQNPLDGLALLHAKEYIGLCKLENSPIEAAILGAATVEGYSGLVAYPKLIELAVDLYGSKARQDEDIRPEDFSLRSQTFSGKLAELIERLLRSYKRPDLEWTLKHLAVARRFDEPLFKHVVERCGTQMPHSDWSMLSNLSLVHRQPDGRWRAFHGVVREGLEGLLAPDHLRRTREALIEYYERDFDALDGHAAETDWDRRIAIASSATESFYHRRRLDARSALFWWNRTGRRFHDAGLARAVESIDRESVMLAESLFGAQSNWAGARASWLASNLDAQGRHGEAEPLHRRDLAIGEKVLGPEHRYTATSLSNLAYNFDAQGRHGEAEPLHRRALAIYEKVLGPEHRDTATILSKLACNFDAQGRHGEAEPLHRRAEASHRRALGRQHPRLARTLALRAINLRSLSRNDEACALARESEAIMRASMLPTHFWWAELQAFLEKCPASRD